MLIFRNFNFVKTRFAAAMKVKTSSAFICSTLFTVDSGLLLWIYVNCTFPIHSEQNLEQRVA